ncbi:hypothetical protein LSE82_003929 [Salmonella enterica]|nr:hypothetical protein [Salmonella enterica]
MGRLTLTIEGTTTTLKHLTVVMTDLKRKSISTDTAVFENVNAPGEDTAFTAELTPTTSDWKKQDTPSGSIYGLDNITTTTIPPLVFNVTKKGAMEVLPGSYLATMTAQYMSE